jgi:CheY-like chemotaxis protein
LFGKMRLSVCIHKSGKCIKVKRLLKARHNTCSHSRIIKPPECRSVRLLLHFFFVRYCGEYEIVLAADGMEALRHVAEHDLALVITDNHMPRLSGLELAAIVKAQQPAAYVLLMSADLGDAIEPQAYQAGADAFLTKPFHIAQLQAILDRVWAARPERTVGQLTAPFGAS